MIERISIENKASQRIRKIKRQGSKGTNHLNGRAE
jgi:hypothetical protein